jgi:hypothetical protein
MHNLLQDVKYALRMLTKNPGFTAVAVLTLALGIGANTSVFSLLDTVLLKLLPVRDPQQLVLLHWTAGPRADMIQAISGTYSGRPDGGGASTSFSVPMYEELRRNNGVFESVIAYTEIDRLNARVEGAGDIVYGQVVSGNYYAGLGVAAYAGRTLLDEDNVAGAPPAAMISHRYWQRRFAAGLMGVFAGLALTLAAIGIYGVMSSAVAQRGREIGIRMALGARAGDILRMVVGQGLLVCGIGVTLGLAGAFGLTRLLGSLLYGVGAYDPATFVSVTLLLFVAAGLACFIPARRATRVDPLMALRHE